MVSNRAYIMTQVPGNYLVVGSPRARTTLPIKYMKYAILMNQYQIKILFIQNTRMALEVYLHTMIISHIL